MQAYIKAKFFTPRAAYPGNYETTLAGDIAVMAMYIAVVAFAWVAAH